MATIFAPGMRGFKVTAATTSANVIESAAGTHPSGLATKSARSSGKRIANSGSLMKKTNAYMSAWMRNRRADCAMRSGGRPVVPARSRASRGSSVSAEDGSAIDGEV